MKPYFGQLLVDTNDAYSNLIKVKSVTATSNNYGTIYIDLGITNFTPIAISFSNDFYALFGCNIYNTGINARLFDISGTAASRLSNTTVTVNVYYI